MKFEEKNFFFFSSHDLKISKKITVVLVMIILILPGKSSYLILIWRTLVTVNIRFDLFLIDR